MNQSKTCGEPCAVCDGCLDAHDAALKARVAALEADNGRVFAALTNREACIGWLEDDIGQLKNNADELGLENDTLRARVAVLEDRYKNRGLLMDHYISALAEIADGRPEPVDYARSVLRVDPKTAVQVQSDRQQAFAGRKEVPG